MQKQTLKKSIWISWNGKWKAWKNQIFSLEKFQTKRDAVSREKERERKFFLSRIFMFVSNPLYQIKRNGVERGREGRNLITSQEKWMKRQGKKCKSFVNHFAKSWVKSLCYWWCFCERDEKMMKRKKSLKYTVPVSVRSYREEVFDEREREKGERNSGWWWWERRCLGKANW